MNRHQIVCIAVGGIFLLWFTAPLFARGMFNIGNATGIAVFGALILYGIFYARIHAFLHAAWQTRGGRLVLFLAGILAVVILITAAVETAFMVRAAMRKPPENTTAVVLGCSVKGTRPSTILKERMDAAYRYLTENEEAYCILSGGQGTGEDISEAECMYRYLTEKGIDPERLIREDTSSNTEENLTEAKRLLQEHGLGNEITIVTSEFHEYRANAMAGRLGLVSYSTPSVTFFAFLPTYYVRELYGILYYAIGK